MLVSPLKVIEPGLEPWATLSFLASLEEFPSGTDEEALGRWTKWNLSDCPVSEKFLPGLQTRFRCHHLLEAFPDYSMLLPQNILAHCASFCYGKSLDRCDQFRNCLVPKITAPSKAKTCSRCLLID